MIHNISYHTPCIKIPPPKWVDVSCPEPERRLHPWKRRQTAIAPEVSARPAVFPADCTRRERSAPSTRSAHRRALRAIRTTSYYLSVAAWTQGFKLRWRLVWIDIGGTGINCASSRDSAFRWNVMQLLL